MMNLADPLLAEAAPLQSDRIEPVSMSIARRRRFGKWEHIASDGSAATDERVLPNTHKVMHRTQRPHLRPVADGHVSAQRRCIGQYDVITNPAIVRNVCVGHYQRVAAQMRQPATLYRSPVYRDKFSDRIVIADLEARRLTRIGQVLRRQPD